MNKKILVVVTAILVTAFTGYGVSKSMNNSNTKLSDLTLANIEALAQSEEGGGRIMRGYYNETVIIYNFSGDLGYKYLGITIQYGASGALTYCEASMWPFRECDTSLNGFVPFN